MAPEGPAPIIATLLVGDMKYSAQGCFGTYIKLAVLFNVGRVSLGRALQSALSGEVWLDAVTPFGLLLRNKQSDQSEILEIIHLPDRPSRGNHSTLNMLNA